MSTISTPLSSAAPFADLAARAAAAGGKPLFSAEAAAADVADRVEPGAEQKKKAKVEQKAVDVAGSLKLKLEEQEKKSQSVIDRADTKLGNEERAKADKLGTLKDKLGAQEEDVKARADSRLTHAEERAKGSGRELNPELADALKTRVADEAKQKGGRLDATADRFQSQEQAIKARMKERLDDRVGKIDERQVKTADRGAMRLEGLEEKMKQLEQSPADKVGGGGAEESAKQEESRKAIDRAPADKLGGGGKADENRQKEMNAKSANTDGTRVI